MTETIKAIPVDVPSHQQDQIAAQYLVMVAYAGRSDRTGGKVHLATLTVWKTGHETLGPCHCSGNGRLRGSMTLGADFAAVSCRNCGAGDEAAERRNAKAIEIEVKP